MSLCLNCGNDFNAKRNRKKFCSLNCKKQYWRKTNKEKKKKDRIEFIALCNYCGASFKTSRRNKQYCRDSCKMASFYSGKEKQPIIRLCAHCHNKIDVTKNTDIIFCNEQCEMSYLEKNKKITKKVDINTLCQECRKKLGD